MAIDTSFFSHPLSHVRAQNHNVGDVDFGDDGNKYRWDGVKWSPEGGGGGSSSGGFNFDWEAARKAAFDPDHPENSVLGRYYLQKLKDAGDDVTRAKRIIEEDYSRGVRVASEDYQMASQDEALTAKQETRDTLGGLNKRGVLFGEMDPNQGTSKAPYSEYAKDTAIGPMEERQGMRRLAIQRALDRQKEVEGLSKQRGVEEQNVQFPRTQQELQEETRNKAYNQQVPQQYAEQYQKFQATNPNNT